MLWNVLSMFVYFVSQCLHPAIPTLGRFLLEIFYKFSMNTVMLCSGAIDNDRHTVIRPWIPGQVNSVVVTLMTFQLVVINN